MSKPHRFRLEVRFGDLDSAGIVYYPRYLHFCHVGMEEYYRHVVGIDYPAFLDEHGLGLPAVRTEVDHRRPIRYRDQVELEVHEGLELAPACELEPDDAKGIQSDLGDVPARRR